MRGSFLKKQVELTRIFHTERAEKITVQTILHLRSVKTLGLIKTTGVVTKTVKYGETSLIVTIVTNDMGRISAIANNVRTNKSGMMAGLQLFAYSEFVMYKSKSKTGLYRLNELTVLESFSDIRESLEKLAYASYFSEVVNRTTAEDDADGEVLPLLLNVLYVLDRDLQGSEKIKTVFEWRLSAVAGYAPQLGACSSCRAENAEFLLLISGCSVCEKCAEGREDAVRISPLMCKIINFICGADGKKIFSFDAPEDSIKYLSRISELYIEAQFEQKFPTLDYLKKVTALEDNAT